jgi:hypothetical protein
VVTDYIDLARRLKNLAERIAVPKEKIDHILDGFASSMNTKGKTRKFRELLEGRFRLTEVVHNQSQKRLYQIQETMKIGNGYGIVLNRQLKDFVNEV